MNEVVLDSLDEFIRTLNELGVEKIAFSEYDENRAHQHDDKTLSLVRNARAEILAYRGSVLYKCILTEADHDAAVKLLESHGFDVTRRNRNIL